METRRVKVAILGAGTAGLTAHGIINKHTNDYVVIHTGPLGTTCARVGCMPSKAMIQIAEEVHSLERLVDIIKTLTKQEPTTKNVLTKVRSLRDFFTSFTLDSAAKISKNNIIYGNATFLSANSLEVDGQVIEFEAVIIATGSSPIVPAIWEKYGDKIITSDEIFELDELPKSLAVIGIGVVGLELGQAVSRLGVEVFGFGRSGFIGGCTDSEVNSTLLNQIGKEFAISFDKSLNVELNDKTGLLVVSNSSTKVEVEKVLVALGREPNLASLNIQKSGIKLDERGMPNVDLNTMQVEGKPIFITGDANAQSTIVHEATDDARIAAYNALNLTSVKRFKRATRLSIVFSDPQVAIVGKSYFELDLSKTVIASNDFDFGRPIIMGKPYGLIRLYADKDSKKLIGGELCGPKVEHMAHMLSWSIQQETSVIDLIRMPFYHPTIEESVQDALRKLGEKLYSKDELFELVTM